MVSGYCCRHARLVCLAVLVACLLVMTGSVSLAATYDLYPPDMSAIANCQPGDTFILHAGTYNRVYTGTAWSGKGGSAGSWVTIMGAPGEARPKVLYTGGNNTFEMPGVHYMKFQYLEIQGGSEIFRFTGTCHDITLEDIWMHDPSDGCVNLSAITETYNLTVRNCNIGPCGSPGYGESFYLGHHQATSQPQVHDSLIERNYIHDSGADGVELKHGCYNVTVRDNVLGNNYYPSITIYGTYSTITSRRYQVYRNFFYGSPDSCIQCTSDADIYNNVFTNPSSTCLNIRSRDIDGKLQYINVVNNTFFNAAGDLIAYRNGNIGANVLFANNAMIQGSAGASAFNAYNGASASTTITNNLTYGYNSNVSSGLIPAGSPAAVFVNPSTTLGQMDLYPAAGSPLIDAGTNGPVAGFAVPSQDFNCLVRPNNGTADIGAYEYYAGSATDPGWKPAAAFKTSVGVPGDVDLDGQVILSDLKLLVAAWNSSKGLPAYNRNADSDNDGTITLADLKLLVANWNRF